MVSILVSIKIQTVVCLMTTATVDRLLLKRFLLIVRTTALL